MAPNSSSSSEDITTLGTYRPWRTHTLLGGDSSNYPETSKKLLDLKSGHASAVEYFRPYLAPAVGRNCAIAVVPSHNPANTQSGLKNLAKSFCGTDGRTDATDCLIRHTKIQKLATGGARDVSVHLKSITISEPSPIAGQNVLLLDDVKTTGHSLLACKKILLDAGANSVRLVALTESG